MKTFFKFALGFIVVLVLAGAAGFGYLNLAFPKVSPAENFQVKSTPERLTRGRYLAENVTGCFGCHSDRYLDRYNFPLKTETRGQGGFLFDKKLMGLPGSLSPPNITPYNLKDWTDGEIVRTLRCGVDKNGKALFPLMPYPNFSKLCQEDLYSIVAYIRSIKPVTNNPPATKLDFPVNFIVRTIPHDAGAYPPPPDRKNALVLGTYLVNAASCAACHTPVDGHGAPLPGMDFAGGMEFHFPDGSTIRPANITPDKKTGIGDWTKDYFIQRFRQGKKMADSGTPVKPGEFNTLMPWPEFGAMTDGDLGAIYDYLRNNVKPVNHNVEKFTPPRTQTASAK